MLQSKAQIFICVGMIIIQYIQMNKHGTLDIEYLIKENRKLRVELKEAQTLSQLHKEAVIKLSDKTANTHEVVKVLCNMLRHSGEENVRERLRDQIFNLQGQIMVLEKIVNQTYENQRETYLLLAEQFRKVQQQNVKMELQLHKFYQKIGEVDYLSGLVTKYKEIVTPSEWALVSKKNEENMLDMLNLQREQLRKLIEQKQKLMKINVHMKEEVQRKKDQVKNMTMMILNDDKFQHNNSMILAELEQQDPKLAQSFMQIRNNLTTLNASTNNLNTTLNFVKLQRQLIKQVDQDNLNDDSQDSDEDMNCPQLSILFPDKVQQIRTNRAEMKVPYLNMKKVRELMMKREEKLKKQIQAEGHHVNPTNKIIQLESQLEITRKELTSQMLKFRTMIDENKRMAQHIIELQTRNEMLVNSNNTLSQNYKHVYKDYQLCKSITNEVQRILGKQITQQNVLNARQELTTIIIVNNEINQQQDKVNRIVNSIFRQKHINQRRTLSP